MKPKTIGALLATFALGSLFWDCNPAKAQVPASVAGNSGEFETTSMATNHPAPLDFHFDATISRKVLENYLSRSISFNELLHDDLTQPRNRRGEDPRDNIRLLRDSRAKFVGRSLMLWGHEENFVRF